MATVYIEIKSKSNILITSNVQWKNN